MTPQTATIKLCSQNEGLAYGSSATAPQGGAARPTRQSHEIAVDRLEAILLLPVAFWSHDSNSVHPAHGEQHEDDSLVQPHRRLERTIEAMIQSGSKWSECTDIFPHYDKRQSNNSLPLDAMRDYSEFVYFHPFARNFLYTTRDDARHAAKNHHAVVNRNMRVLRRTDLKSIAFTWYDSHLGCQSCELNCRSCQFFVFDSGIGILAVDLETAQKASCPNLRQVLSLLDYSRRIYSPYWNVGDHGTSAGRCVESAEFHFSDRIVSTNFGRSESDALADDPGRVAIHRQIEKVYVDREPCTATGWSSLLEPLVPRTCATTASGDHAVQYKLVLDDRMQLMSMLQVNGVQDISAGDWVRIANVDDAGDSNKHPYSPAFCESGDFGAMAYDRYWDARNVPEVNTDLCTTRWLSSGYHLAVVGDSKNSFVKDQQSGLPVHFRQHYFKLYLIAQMQLTTLLNFKQRIANALDSLRSDPGSAATRQREFTDQILSIEADFLHFRNTYWFPDVTNQVQGRELYALVCKQLGTQRWFDLVREEIQDAAAMIQVRDMVRSVGTIQHMQTNIEWVELFIVGVYAVELPYAFAHLWHIDSGFFRWSATVLAILTVVLFAWLTKPWAQRHQAKRLRVLLPLAVLWAGMLAASVWLQPKATEAVTPSEAAATNGH